MIFSEFELILIGGFLIVAVLYYKQAIRNDVKDEYLYHLSRIIAGVADGELQIKRDGDTVHITKAKDSK